MKSITPKKRSNRKSQPSSVSKRRKPSKSPSYNTHSTNIPLKRSRTPRKSRNKSKRGSRTPKRLKSTDSFEVIRSSIKKDSQKKEKKDSSIREKFQIISNDVEIDENMILEFKQRANFFKTDYLVFGIIGTQSTGKSTLLNNLFNCEFDMLNAKKGRRQTTKGIWGSFIDEERMLVLDIEGSDSMERSMKDQNAENKICTFGLLMTHVLLSMPSLYVAFLFFLYVSSIFFYFYFTPIQINSL